MDSDKVERFLRHGVEVELQLKFKK